MHLPSENLIAYPVSSNDTTTLWQYDYATTPGDRNLLTPGLLTTGTSKLAGYSMRERMLVRFLAKAQRKCSTAIL